MAYLHLVLLLGRLLVPVFGTHLPVIPLCLICWFHFSVSDTLVTFPDLENDLLAGTSRAAQQHLQALCSRGAS